MSKAEVINVSEARQGDVYIGRPGRGMDGFFGNPFKIGPHPVHGLIDRERSLRLFGYYFRARIEHDLDYKQRIEACRGLRLACFCSPMPCHGDIIAEYLNARFPE